MTVTKRPDCRTQAYSLRFADHNCIRRRLRGFSDRKMTNELARLVEQLVSYRSAREPFPPDLQRRVDVLPPDVTQKLARMGILDAARLAAAVPLAALAEQYRLWLLDAARTEQHAHDTHARCCRVIEGCGFARSSDVRADAVMRLLASFRDGTGPQPDAAEGRRGAPAKGCCGRSMSQAAANGHLTAFKSFTRWLVQGEHATDTAAMAAVQRVRPVTVTKKPHERRALQEEELKRLLASTEAGPVRAGTTGPERATLYRVAVGTGLRAGELRRLRRCDLHLIDPDAATLTVRAESSKNGKAATLPLRRDLARELLDVMVSKMPSAAALVVPGRQHCSRVLAADLDHARAAWVAEAGTDATWRIERESSDFLAVRDHADRVLDFHCFRHTFVTNLCANNVPVKVAQTLARHSDVRTTLNIYAHAEDDALAEGVAALPAFRYGEKESAVSATGTTDAEPARPASARTLYGPHLGQNTVTNGHESVVGRGGIHRQDSPFSSEKRPIRGANRARPGRDSNPRITDLQSVPLVRLGTRPGAGLR